jgi:hypothetical protein
MLYYLLPVAAAYDYFSVGSLWVWGLVFMGLGLFVLVEGIKTLRKRDGKWWQYLVLVTMAIMAWFYIQTMGSLIHHRFLVHLGERIRSEATTTQLRQFFSELEGKIAEDPEYYLTYADLPQKTRSLFKDGNARLNLGVTHGGELAALRVMWGGAECLWGIEIANDKEPSKYVRKKLMYAPSDDITCFFVDRGGSGMFR